MIICSKGGSGGGSSTKGGKKEICKCFNRGKCTYGLGCKFDYRCAGLKCGKFGHGAHIYWVRLAEVNAAAADKPESSNSDAARK